MAEIVYVLCALMSLLCALMLFRGYRRTGTHLLLWSCMCFCLLALNNAVLVIDLVIFPNMNMNGQMWRTILSSSAGSLLLFGLIWEIT